MTTATGIGPSLARQGLNAMFHHSVQYGTEQAGIGGTYLDSIELQSQDANEKTVAKTAKEAWNDVEKWRGQVAVANAALSAIAGGTVGGPLGAALAHVGAEAMYNDHITTIRDQAFVGLAFTAAVRDNTTDDTQRALAATALRSAQNASQARTQVAILGNFLTSQ